MSTTTRALSHESALQAVAALEAATRVLSGPYDPAERVPALDDLLGRFVSELDIGVDSGDLDDDPEWRAHVERVNAIELQVRRDLAA